MQERLSFERELEDLGLAERELPSFYDSDIILSQNDTYEVLQFFWPELTMPKASSLTMDDRAFAQALLVEALNCTYSMGWLEKTFKSTVNAIFKQSHKSLVQSVAKEAVRKALFEKKASDKIKEDLNDIKIYESCRAKTASNWKSIFRSRIQTDDTSDLPGRKR